MFGFSMKCLSWLEVHLTLSEEKVQIPDSRSRGDDIRGGKWTNGVAIPNASGLFGGRMDVGRTTDFGEVRRRQSTDRRPMARSGFGVDGRRSFGRFRRDSDRAERAGAQGGFLVRPDRRLVAHRPAKQRDGRRLQRLLGPTSLRRRHLHPIRRGTCVGERPESGEVRESADAGLKIFSLVFLLLWLNFLSRSCFYAGFDAKLS